MLKKGLAWHYAAYDQRIELATVSKQQLLFILTRQLRTLDSDLYKLCYNSGKRRLEQSESDSGHHQTLRSHGSGGRTDEKGDKHCPY